MFYRDEVIVHSLAALRKILDPIEYVITVDHRAVWRRHLAWAFQDGGELRAYLVQRYSANMVFMSLMLSAALMVLFNSSRLTSEMRQAMYDLQYDDVKFWIGLMIMISVFLILFTLVANFTAWGIVSSISANNAHCILRSSLGQYAAQLPSQLLVSAMYSFLIWILLWVFEMMPLSVAIAITVVMGSLFLHIVAVYSALGRLIIHTGAMGQRKIFSDKFEQALLPSGLTSTLVSKAIGSPNKRVTATAHYRGSDFTKNSTQFSRSGILEEPGHSKITESQTQPPAPMQPWGAPDSSLSSASADSVRIRNTAYAMFGSGALRPSSDSEVPMNPGQMPSSSTEASAVDPFEMDLPGEGEGNDTKTGIAASVPGVPDSSIIGGGGVGGRGFTSPPRRRRRQRRIRQSRRSRAEWEHESIARMMYGAPPAAIDEEDDDTAPTTNTDHPDDHAVRHASMINKATVGARPRRLLWNDMGETNLGDTQTSYDGEPGTIALTSVTEEKSFEEEESTPEKRGLLQDAIEKGTSSYN